jgi:hypothetical protein
MYETSVSSKFLKSLNVEKVVGVSWNIDTNLARLEGLHIDVCLWQHKTLEYFLPVRGIELTQCVLCTHGGIQGERKVCRLKPI